MPVIALQIYYVKKIANCLISICKTSLLINLKLHSVSKLIITLANVDWIPKILSPSDLWGNFVHAHYQDSQSHLEYVSILLKFTNAADFITSRRYASAVYAVVVCPSVCPSLCLSRRYCSKTAKHRTTQTTPYGNDIPWTLICWCQRSRRNSNGVTPTGAPSRGGVGSNRRFSTSNSLYLKTVQDRDIVTMER